MNKQFKASKTKLYKRFHLNQKTAKPGDLMAKAKKYKRFPFATPKMMAGALSGVARMQKAANPMGVQPILRKTMCKMCGKTHEKGKHLKSRGKHKTHKKNWIQNAIKKPGALHQQLGVKAGHKIPASKLAAAAKKGGKEGQRARLAQTLKSFHHKKVAK